MGHNISSISLLLRADSNADFIRSKAIFMSTYSHSRRQTMYFAPRSIYRDRHAHPAFSTYLLARKLLEVVPHHRKVHQPDSVQTSVILLPGCSPVSELEPELSQFQVYQSPPDSL